MYMQDYDEWKDNESIRLPEVHATTTCLDPEHNNRPLTAPKFVHE